MPTLQYSLRSIFVLTTVVAVVAAGINIRLMLAEGARSREQRIVSRLPETIAVHSEQITPGILKWTCFGNENLFVRVTSVNIEREADLDRLGELALLPHLHHLSVTCYVPRAHVESIVALRNLETLHIRNCDISSDGISALQRMAGLTRLWLGGPAVGDDEVKALGAVVQLRELYICAPLATPDGMSPLAQLTNLEVFEIEAPSISDRQLHAFSALRQLSVFAMRPADDCGDGFLSLAQCDKLTRLTLGPSSCTDTMLAKIAKIASLRMLDIQAVNGITRDGVLPLRQLKTLERIRIPEYLEDGVRQ